MQLAAQRNSWPEVTSLAQRAVTIVQAGHFDDYWSSAIVYAWAARAALHQGNISLGRFYLGRAARLRPLLTYMLPVVSVQALLEMAHSYITLADPAGAAAVLTQADASSSNGQTSASSRAGRRTASPRSPPSRRAPSARRR